MDEFNLILSSKSDILYFNDKMYRRVRNLKSSVSCKLHYRITDIIVKKITGIIKLSLIHPNTLGL